MYSCDDPLRSFLLCELLMHSRVLVPDYRFCANCNRVSGLGACACCAFQELIKRALLAQELHIKKEEVWGSYT
jgi:hypothetical protein